MHRRPAYRDHYNHVDVLKAIFLRAAEYRPYQKPPKPPPRPRSLFVAGL